MKRLLLCCLAFCGLFSLRGQVGISTTIDTRAITNHEWRQDFAVAPSLYPVSFYAFSARIEGKKLLDEIIFFKLECLINNVITESYDLMLSPESDKNADEIWISTLAFMSPVTQNIRLVLRTKSPIGENVRNVTTRLFAPTNAKSNDAKFASPEGLCDRPPAISRAQWGAQWSLRDTDIYSGSPTITTVTHLAIHHGASPNTATNFAAVVASYFDYHINTNGWSDIGYNWLVAPDGTLFTGRGGGDNVQGAHFCGKNANTMGVCLIGDYQTVAPSAAMLATLSDILAWKASQRNINVLGSSVHYGAVMNHLVGHRDGCATSCPGEMTYALLPTIKNTVAAKVAQCALRVSDFSTVGSIKIMPNPISDRYFTISASLKNIQPIELHLIAANGQEVLQQVLSQNSLDFTEKIDVSGIASGVYFVYLVVGDKFTTEKIVIAH